MCVYIELKYHAIKLKGLFLTQMSERSDKLKKEGNIHGTKIVMGGGSERFYSICGLF